MSDVFMTTDQLLAHWQAHRRLSRRVIVAFPEDQLFTFSLGGMRPMGELALEMLGMAVPMLRQIAGEAAGAPEHHDKEWRAEILASERPVAELLRRWDESTAEIDALWPQVTPGRFQETMKAFGQWEGRVCDLLMYVIDNEVHHRGQGYIYLRALGVEPPPFWVRD
jgi:uncharacterized damage-inducible protein DinB